MSGESGPATDRFLRQRNPFMFLNPFTQHMLVIEAGDSFDSVLRKNGQPPASKASIDSMPVFKIIEDGDDGDKNRECPICLDEMVVGDVAREVPCKHRFHGKCIEKWLGIHGSCPVCRYKMPVDDEKKRDEDEASRDRARDREIWFSISISRRNSNSDSDSDSDYDPVPVPVFYSDSDSDLDYDPVFYSDSDSDHDQERSGIDTGVNPNYHQL